MLSVGAVGPYKDYLLAFMGFQQDPKKKKSFGELFPDIDDFMRLRDHRQISEAEKAQRLAQQMLMMGSEGAPQWIIDKANGV